MDQEARDPQDKDALTIMAICSMIDLAKYPARLDDIAQKISKDDTITAAEREVLRRVWQKKKEQLHDRK
jgi:muramidase (phage lysozyme)